MSSNKGNLCHWVERPLFCQETDCGGCQIYQDVKEGEMANKHLEVKVIKFPPCDFCKSNPLVSYQAAHYDGKTKSGPWAFMCDEHFKQRGRGLGLGRGQELILEKGG